MIVVEFLKEFWNLTTEMAPYLLLGFLLAGFMHVLIPKGWLLQHLSKPTWSSVWKATLVGVPLPLCSCGVIPVAAKLDKEGAAKGASISFLTSTPSTGLDSIFATWGMMGPAFTLLRTVYSVVTGLLAGSLANLSSPTSPLENTPTPTPLKAHLKSLSLKESLKEALEYGFVELLRDAKKWLLLGLLLGAALSVFIPADFYASLSQNPLLSYLVMILIGTPMYICATGSIPIAAALASQGLSVGAVLIFLTVGPATNSATLAFVYEKLGRKTLSIYLLTLVFTAVGTGVLADFYFADFLAFQNPEHHHENPSIFNQILAGILLLGILRFYLPKPKLKGITMKLKIPTMMCSGCAANIEKLLKAEPRIEGFSFNIPEKTVDIQGQISEEELKEILAKGNYPAED